MCGRIRLQRHKRLDDFLQEIKAQGDPIYADDRAPGDQISIILEMGGERRIEPAIWWLLLDTDTLKPNYKFASFNSRYDKINLPRSASYAPYRKSRCIIPATAIIEGIGEGKERINHMIEQVDGPMICGGVYKTWFNRATGELINSCSIITLPPVNGWENIHNKAMPLMLPREDKSLLDKWLDPAFDQVEVFDYLLEPVIRYPQIATRIGKVSKWDPVAKSFRIEAQAI